MNLNSVNQKIQMTVSVLRRSSDKGDLEICAELMALGLDRRLSARLVEFLPMAYCRVMLEGQGLQFSNFFQRRLSDGSMSEVRQLDSEPLWKTVLDFAQEDVKRGVASKDLLVVAGRGAEFDAANQLLNSGSKMKDIKFTPILFPWPEAGPEIPVKPGESKSR